MKLRIFIITIIVSLASLTTLFAQGNSNQLSTNISFNADSIANANKSTYEKALDAYNEGDFYEAISLFQKEIKSLEEEGKESATLYYNLGNAYFRAKDYPRARLNYERSILINPLDKDVQNNLDFVINKIESKKYSTDTFILTQWYNQLLYSVTSNTWAYIGIAFFLFFIVNLFIFVFSKNVFIKKLVFYVGISAVVLSILCNWFSYSIASKLADRQTAIVLPELTTLLKAPDPASETVFQLHGGAKVDIIKEDKNWIEVKYANDKVGWLQKDVIEVI